MAEEVKIVISETRQGNAVEEEKKRLEELNKAGAKQPPDRPAPKVAPAPTQQPPQKPTQATPAPAPRPAPAPTNPPLPVSDAGTEIARLHKAADHYASTGNDVAAKSARADAVDLQKKQIAGTMARANAERAAGNTASAALSEREVGLMQRTLSLQTRLNIGYSEAVALARSELVVREKELAVKAEEAALKKQPPQKPTQTPPAPAPQPAPAPTNPLLPVSDAGTEIARLHKAADHYASTGNDVAAKSARAAAYDLQKKQLTGAMATEAAQRVAGNNAAADATGREVWQMERALSLQSRLNLGYTEAVALARSELGAREKELAVKAEEAALKKAGISSGSSGLRGGRLGQIGQFLGSGLRTSGETGFAITIGLMLQHAIDTQTEALRSAIAQTRDQGYQLDEQNRHTDRALSTVNGPAAEFGMEAGMQDQSAGLARDVEDKQDQIDKLEKEKIERAASWGVYGAAAGALAGGFFGNPVVGGAIGAALGSGAGALYNKVAIDPQEDQVKAQQGMDSGEKGLIDAQRKKLDEQRKGELQDEISMAEAESKHDYATVRGLKEKISWTKRYREAKAEGADEQQSQELANLAVYRERQKTGENIAAGMMTARTGAAEAASIARFVDEWKRGPGSGADHGAKLDAINHTLNNHLGRLNDSQIIQDPNE